jgi:hypothetical protein
MALDMKMWKYYVAIWNILRTCGTFCDPLVRFVLIWDIFPILGIMQQEKSGNQVPNHFRRGLQNGTRTRAHLLPVRRHPSRMRALQLRFPVVLGKDLPQIGRPLRQGDRRPGVDEMITIFCDF